MTNYLYYQRSQSFRKQSLPAENFVYAYKFHFILRTLPSNSGDERKKFVGKTSYRNTLSLDHTRYGVDVFHMVVRTRQTVQVRFESALSQRDYNSMVAYNWHLNIEILSRLILLLCRLKVHDLMLYRLPLIIVIATAGRNTVQKCHPQRQHHESLLYGGI